MAIELLIDTLDKVPEFQRGWYVADAGKFKLDPSKVDIEDVGGLKSALANERTANKLAKDAAAKAVADALKPFEGIDPTKTKALLSQFENDQEAKLIAEGKISEVITARMSKRDAELTKQVDAAKAAADAASAVANKYKGRVLDDAVRAAAAKAGLHAFAVDDALLRAKAIFVLDDNGNAVQVGADGQPVLGKDGKTAFSPSEWLETMKETAPHWFPAGSSGGGAGGDKGGNSGGSTMKRAVFDALSPAEKSKTVKTHTIVD